MKLERKLGNFAVAYEQAKDAPASARGLLQARKDQGIDSEVCYPGAWTTENFNCVRENIYGCLAGFNPIIPYRTQAVECHINNREFYLTSQVLLNGKPATEVIQEIAEKDAKLPPYKRRVINLGQTQTHLVSTDSFDKDDGILFLARSKKLAKDFGSFLKKQANILEVTFYLPPIQPQDYARSFWLIGIGHSDRSDFYGNDRDLDNTGGSLFRVNRGRSGKATQKNLQRK